MLNGSPVWFALVREEFAPKRAEMEYAIPSENARTAVRLVRDVAAGSEAPTPLEVRFVASGDASLSLAAFAADRSRLDPTGLFTNKYVARVLGPAPT
uniref:D-arabinono-1,4-lactone oxidase n=1 Tax=Mycobacterium riyadhense TaxID=486698 RepID=A0A653EWZ1_9MYCO|nr:D-arabinono-1,4-lactone oxidase [Mycobacterium riyadhense]